MSRFLKVIALLVMVVSVASIAAGCNRTKSRLPGVWKYERLKVNNNPPEYWIFEDGKVTISSNPSGTGAFAGGKSDYLATNGRIVFSTFGNSYNQYNGKWRIIDISDEILRIANFDNGGMLTREFTKVD